MNAPKPSYQNKPRVLSIAGSDSGGCAGIQADLKVLNALECHGSTVITCVTAQNTMGVQGIEPLSAAIVKQQMTSVLEDIGADAIKIGMLYNQAIISTVAQVCQQYASIPIILDPVCVSTSGSCLLQADALRVLIETLVPLCSLITPNHQEAHWLAERKGMHYSESFQTNPCEWLSCKACLVTGGDATASYVVDTLFMAKSAQAIRFINPKINSKNTHGSGCSLSTAISAFIAMGFNLKDAIEQSISFIRHGIASGARFQLGQGNGPLFFNDIYSSDMTKLFSSHANG